MSSRPTTQYRRWSVTINVDNYDDKILDGFNDVSEYAVFGREKAETGQLHYQGYVFLKKRSTLTALKKINGSAHFEVARSDHGINYEYCTKEDKNPVEFGKFPETSQEAGKKAGKSTREAYEQARQYAKAGTFSPIRDDIYVRHRSALHAIHADRGQSPDNLEDSCGLWIYGPPGVGKSHMARDLCGNQKFYLKQKNKWWDGYHNEPNVIIEEVSTSDKQWLGHFLKIWADRYAFGGEVKGSTIVLRPKRIIITSNYRIDECCSDPTEAEAVMDRFDQYELTGSSRRKKKVKLTGTYESVMERVPTVELVENTDTLPLIEVAATPPSAMDLWPHRLQPLQLRRQTATPVNTPVIDLTNTSENESDENDSE